jgi:hypothetical protein
MEFIPFQKIPRLSREIYVSEKIDGTNASIFISETGEMRFGSRTRWITPEDDNYGFAKWAIENKEDLLTLGPGHHFGEWWGKGIGRNYSQTTKIFSLFNVHRWGNVYYRPACCSVVPVLYQGPFEEFGVMNGIKRALKQLQEQGSVAAPGFMEPEGIIIYHTQSNTMFKKTLKDDEKPKGSKEL